MLLLILSQNVHMDTVRTAPSTTHSPMKAAVLSLALPGGGQFYNRQYLKGAIIGGGEIFLWSTLFYSIRKYRETQQEGYFWTATSVMVGLVWLKLFSTTDAYIDAQFIIAEQRMREIKLQIYTTH